MVKEGLVVGLTPRAASSQASKAVACVFNANGESFTISTLVESAFHRTKRQSRASGPTLVEAMK